MSLVERLGSMVVPRIGARAPRPPSEPHLAALVEERCRALGLSSADAYVEHAAIALDDELRHLAGAFTNGWTWFFRDQAPLVALAERLRARRLARTAYVWVPGCSTGEEAYGLAIACSERGVDARVIGTDVDAARIAIARRGVYGPGSLRRVPSEAIERHFVPADAGHLRVHEELSARVELRVHNLLDPAISPPDGEGWDAIVCRNVLLHCAEESVPCIVSRLESALAPSGQLLLGASDPKPQPREVAPRESAPERARHAPVHRATTILRPRAPAARAKREDDWTRAVSLVRSGAHAEARDLLAAVLAADRTHFAARATQGSLWLSAHRFDLAADAYREAELIEPDSAELWFLWGTLHRKRGAWIDAAAALRRALFLDEELWPARFLLAGVWERTGDLRRCRHGLEETVRSIERRPFVLWRTCVDDIESIACPPEAVRAMCLLRLAREIADAKGARDGG